MEMFDRIYSALRKLVDDATARMDYHALYPCDVVKQNADKTLELQPDNPRIPPMSKVPIRLGIPGATVTIEEGARVLLGFAGGDPNRPIASLWESSTITVLTINGGSVPLAKIGSTTAPHTHSGTAGPYPVMLSSEITTIDDNGVPELLVP